MFNFLVILLSLLMSNAQPTNVPDPVRILVVGTFHMSGDGGMMNPTVKDVLKKRRQAEIQDLVGRLASFKPTKIALEAACDSNNIQQEFKRFVLDNGKLKKDERHQVGFRLAKKLGHKNIYGVDFYNAIDVEGLLTWAQQNGQGDIGFEIMASYMSIASKWTAKFMDESCILEIYRSFNSPDYDEASHKIFTSSIRIGSEKEPIGANLLSQWYDRNIRITTNIVRLAEPGDRILVLFGANHRKLLIDFLKQIPGIEVEDTQAYLN